MSDDNLKNIKVSYRGMNKSLGEAFNLFHDPELIYQVIQNHVEELENGTSIEIENPNTEREVIIRSKVNVFQLAMQYIESFGIYFLSYLKGRENFINDLINIKPKEVKKFFKHLCEETENEYLSDFGIEDDYRDLLEYWLGYRFLNKDDEKLCRSIPWEKFGADDIDELIDLSIDAFDNDIRQIGKFYLYFDKIYNAIKHGDRVIIGASSDISVSSEGEEIELLKDMNFIGFICKEKGDPLIVLLPIKKLLNESLITAEKVRRLFSHIKQVSKIPIHEEEGDIDMKISFIRYTSAKKDNIEWLQGTANNAVVILPKIGRLGDLKINQPSGTFAGRIEIEGDTIVIHTERDGETSPEYPVKITFDYKGPDGLSTKFLGKLDYSFRPTEVDVTDFYEMLQMQKHLDEGDIRKIHIVDEKNNRKFESKPPMRTSSSVGISTEEKSIETFANEEYIEFLSLLERITGIRIPVPLDLSKEQKKMIKNGIDQGTSNLNQKEVEKIVEKLNELGNDRIFTLVLAERITPEGEVIDQEQLGIIQGDFSIRVFPKNLEDDEGPIDITPGKAARFRASIGRCEVEYEDLVNIIKDNLEGIRDLIEKMFEITKPQIESGNETSLYFSYDSQEFGFWATYNTLRIEMIG